MEKVKTQCFIHEKIRNYKKADICAKVCDDLYADYSYNGQSYCILHLPDENKDKSIFIREFNRKVAEENYSFCGVYFPIYVEFESECFESEVDFRSATFTKSVSFIRAKFKENALFSWAKFESDTFFDFVEFKKEAKFDSAIFAKDSDTLFRGTIFNGLANFSYATFNGFIEFGFKDKKSSNLNYDKRPIIEKDNQPNDIQVTFFKSGLKLEHIRLESSNKIIFHSIRLRPNWFVNSDVTEFTFTNCRWKNDNYKNISVKSELSELGERENSHKLLTNVCWQLADNHEKNSSFSKASIFRQFAQESKRLEDNNGWKIWTLHWWYWLTSFYGEIPLWALYVLLYLILLIFPSLFMVTKFQTCPIEKPLSLSLSEDKANQDCQQNVEKCNCRIGGLYFEEAIAQSLTTATLQNVEYRKPLSVWGELWIILEKIFAPLQAALLALAIRRKFMR